jgi:hypothetical protein
MKLDLTESDHLEKLAILYPTGLFQCQTSWKIPLGWNFRNGNLQFGFEEFEAFSRDSRNVGQAVPDRL